MSPTFLVIDSEMLVFSSILELKIKISKPYMHAHANFGPGVWENWKPDSPLQYKLLKHEMGK